MQLQHRRKLAREGGCPGRLCCGRHGRCRRRHRRYGCCCCCCCIRACTKGVEHPSSYLEGAGLSSGAEGMEARAGPKGGGIIAAGGDGRMRSGSQVVQNQFSPRRTSRRAARQQRQRQNSLVLGRVLRECTCTRDHMAWLQGLPFTWILQLYDPMHSTLTMQATHQQTSQQSGRPVRSGCARHAYCRARLMIAASRMRLQGALGISAPALVQQESPSSDQHSIFDCQAGLAGGGRLLAGGISGHQ